MHYDNIVDVIFQSPEYKPIEVTPSEVNPGNLKAVFYLTYGLNVGERYTCSVGDEEGQVVSRSATALLYGKGTMRAYIVEINL